MRKHNAGLLACLLLLVSLILALPGGTSAALSPSFRVSVSSDGVEANADSGRSSISADGRYVAFESGATNLVDGDTNDAPDIFLHDRVTGETTRVSLAWDGQQANGGSNYAAVSGDGRYVAFISSATNLVQGDTNGVDDVFVRDRQAGTTIRVSVSSLGEQGNNHSDRSPALSANGRFVAFLSEASNLVDGDNNLMVDAFVHDLQGGSTERVSVSSDEVEAEGSVWDLSISADGNFAAFSSRSTNLVSGDNNNSWDVFVRDRAAGTTTRVTVNSNGEEADRGGGEPDISANGRYVVFSSAANNLMSEDNNGYPQVFRHDRQTGATTLVSSYEDYGPLVGWGEVPVVSADGRYVAFEFDEKGDGLPGRQIYLHDCVTGATMSVAPGYDETDSSHSPAISSDGRFLAFSSDANYLVPDDANDARDVFEREVYTPVVKTYQSNESYDGWIIESSENSGEGGHADSNSTTLYVGDAANDQQYRALLHFDTASLPNNAVIIQAVLKIKKQGLTGGNPFNTLGVLWVDIRKPFFGPAAELEISDFEAAASLDAAGAVGSGLSGGWYTAALDPSAIAFIHPYGATQFRLRFNQGDNDNGEADFLKLFSGDAAAGDQPYLYLEYYVPIEKYPVVLAIQRASPTPGGIGQVAYTVVFNESVTGVDVSDFVLTTHGALDASVVEVSGSDDTWSVLVDITSAGGTLRLDLLDDDSIRDTSQRRLGGYDPGNGDFTAGEVYTVGQSTFADVPLDHWAWQWIQSMYMAGITSGCGGGNYCPNQAVTRAQMAVFLERGMNDSTYTPPPATGTIFNDIPADHWAGAWIEQLAADGITGGCGNGNYCPDLQVTRAQMAVFLLSAEHGPGYTPPAVGDGTGFNDVPVDHWAAAWIKQLAAEGITGGCGGGNYCPTQAVTRAQMAVFLQITFGLPLP
ncbi:MAG: S-layer homology domain-containing protein [Chloroflexi bacterium]|nr:S-layer homology domain-containing protein [Chloroflexota bacterium]